MEASFKSQVALTPHSAGKSFCPWRLRRADTPSPGALARLSRRLERGAYIWGLGPKAPAAGGAAYYYPSPGPAVPALDLSRKGRG
jgi:hypothetical protein